MASHARLQLLQRILQVTEYVDSLCRYNRDLTIDDFQSNPIPEVDTIHITYKSIEQRLQKMVAEQGAEIYANQSIHSMTTQSKVVGSKKMPVSHSQAVAPQDVPVVQQSDHSPVNQHQSINSDLIELQKIIQKVCKIQSIDQFINYPTDQCIQSYSVYVPYPMSLTLIYSRFYQNMSQNKMPEISDNTEPNILVCCDYEASYGRMAKYYINSYTEDFYLRSHNSFLRDPMAQQREIQKHFKNDKQVPPYQYITEIVRDFYLIALNCWYFNYQTPLFVDFAIKLIQTLYEQFVQHYSASVWPYWAQIMGDDVRSLKNSETQVEMLRAVYQDMKDWKQGKTNHISQWDHKNYRESIQLAPSSNTAVKQEIPLPDVQFRPPSSVAPPAGSLSLEELRTQTSRLFNKLSDKEKQDDQILDITNGDEIANLDHDSLNRLLAILKH